MPVCLASPPASVENHLLTASLAIQGKDCLVQKFRNSSVMLEAPHYRPKVGRVTGKGDPPANRLSSTTRRTVLRLSWPDRRSHSPSRTTSPR